MRVLLLFLTLVSGSLLFVEASSGFAIQVSNREDYLVYSKNDYRYIYTKPHQGLITSLAGYNEWVQELYEKEFEWKLDEYTALILPSTRNQIANGFATVSPNNMTAWYTVAPGLMDYFAVRSWLATLMFHEGSHMYQLNVKSTLSKLAKTVSGNAYAFPVVFVPLMIHPNGFMPSTFTEGNATYNENRFGMGGRMYSGEVRATVFSLIKDHKVNWKRLMNEHLAFPMGQEHYIVGGYFFTYLAEKYGAKKTNSLFKVHSSGINQFHLILVGQRVNQRFFAVFDKGYEELLQDFLGEYEPLASKQQSSPDPAIAKSFFSSDLNSDDEQVFFTVNEEQNSYPSLVTVDRNSGEVKIETLNLPGGKVFRLSDTGSTDDYYVRSSQKIDVENITYALYGEGLKPKREYLDQFVYDIKAGHTLYAKASESPDHPLLYVDGQKFGPSHSSALLDKQGNIYYFKQHKNQRTLYKNQQALTTFDGFYGKPSDIGEDGTVYFIASTATGASLFAYRGDKVYRQSSSDTIVDAKHLKGNQFVVSEVNSEGHSFKIVELPNSGSKLESPYYYKYAWEKEPNFSQEPVITQQAPPPAEDTTDYGGLSQMRYSQLQFGSFGYVVDDPDTDKDESGFIGSVTALFVDPLFDNTIYVGAAQFTDARRSAAAGYLNQANRLNWYLGVQYEEYADVVERFGVKSDGIRYYDNLYFLGVSYPVFRWREWGMNFSNEWSYESLDLLNDSAQQNYGWTAALRLSRSKAYAKSYTYYRHTSLSLAHKLETEAPEWRRPNNITALNGNFIYDIGWENILALRLGAGFADRESLQLSQNPVLAHSKKQANDFYRLTPGTSQSLSEVKYAGLSYTKPIDWGGWYFYKFPFSLRRIAPYVRANYFDTRTDKASTQKDNFTEWAYGIQLRLLYHHRGVATIDIGTVDDNREFTSSNTFVHVNKSFEF